MPTYIGTNKLKNCYVGNRKVVGIYVGLNKVFTLSRGRLPSEYQEVEWVRMPQGAFINTKIYPNLYDICEYKFSLHSHSELAYQPFISAYSHAYLGYSSERKPGYWWKNWLGLSIVRWQYEFNEIIEILAYIKQGKGYAKNVETGLENVQNGIGTDYLSSTTPYAINGRANNGSTTEAMTINYPIDTTYYKMQVWRGNNNGEKGTMVADFVPCYRKSDNVIGMYDLVRNEFFTNAGSGSFTAGSDKLSDTFQTNNWTLTQNIEKRAYQSGDESLENAMTNGYETLLIKQTPTIITKDSVMIPNKINQITDKNGIELDFTEVN